MTNSGQPPDFGQSIVPSDLTNALAVAGGETFSMALNANGTITAWGDNSSGQIDGCAGLTNIVAIAAGYAHGLALKADGTVVGWGSNTTHQCDVSSVLTNVVAIAAGRAHSVALLANGTVTAWGDNSLQQTNVPSGLSNVAAIAAGESHGMALRADGTVRVWGGLPPYPPAPSVALNEITSIAAGRRYCLALKTDGRLVAWGTQTTVPASLSIPAAAVISTSAGTPSTSLSKSTAADGNFVVHGSITNWTVFSSGGNYTVVANSRVNSDVSSGNVSMSNWDTGNELPDYSSLYDRGRMLAVADLSNTHYTNLTSFIMAGKSNVLEGVVAVDVVKGTNGQPTYLDSGDFPNGINIRGTLWFNFVGYGFTTKLYITCPISINPANLSQLNPTNPATFTTGYPPTYINPAKNPLNVDITSRGFTNFATFDELPAIFHDNAIVDMHGPLNICGPYVSAGMVEIENKDRYGTQYIRGPIIGASGVYLENKNVGGRSIFVGESGPLAIAACGENNLALKGNGQLRAWGSPADLPPSLTNVAAIATGVAHSLALLSETTPMFPPQQVRLNNLRRVGSSFSVSLPTRNGRVYALEYKDSFDGTAWTALPLVAGNGGTLTLTDSAATAPQRLYRVRQW